MDEQRVPIFTIGYGNDDIERFVARLARHGIEYLVDVRSQPYSRRSPEFAKHAIEAILAKHGVRYVFLGDALGGRPSDPTCFVNERVVYGLVEERPWYRAGIERLLEAWRQGRRVALMCGEFEAERCHRSRLVGVTLDRAGVPVRHIERDGASVSQAEVMERVTGGQASLFAE